MNSFITSQIRTYVPVAVGAVLTYLAKRYELVVDDQSSAALITGLQALVTGAYYLVARLLERKFPQLGTYLLGSSKTPTYRDPR